MNRRRRRYGRAEGPLGRIEATSFSRYNGGVAVKRAYGSSTVTRFYVNYASDRGDPSKWEEIDGYGRTPGERKTYATAYLEYRAEGPR